MLNDRDRLLQKTNGGYDVFKHFFGDEITKKMFQNPYRKDSTPSCHLYERKHGGETVYVLKDFGASEWCGDCFHVVSKIKGYNMQTDFIDLLKAIDKEMNLFLFDEATAKVRASLPQVQQPIVLTGQRPQKFFAVKQALRESEKKWWLRYGIDGETLERYHVSSLSSCRFVRTDGSSYTISGTYMEPMYGYFFGGNKGIKTYRPFSKARFLYAGELPKPYVFGMDQLPERGDYVILTGGEKDVMSLGTRHIPAVTLNSETASIPDNFLRSLSERFKTIIVMFDCDETGLRESEARIEALKGQYQVKRLVLPLSGTKKEKDVSDFFSLGHTTEEFEYLVRKVLSE